MTNVTRRTKETEMALLTVLFALFNNIIVRFKNAITIHTGETFWMPHLIQSSDELINKDKIS